MVDYTCISFCSRLKPTKTKAFFLQGETYEKKTNKEGNKDTSNPMGAGKSQVEEATS